MKWPILGVLLLLGVALRLPGFWHDVDGGKHLFREAHVAANVYFLAQGGPSLLTRHFTDDSPLMPSIMGPDAAGYRIFDGPLYQNVSAAIIRATRWPLAPVARGVNIALFVLSALTLAALLRSTGMSDRIVAWTLLLYATSPLLVYYDPRGVDMRPRP